MIDELTQYQKDLIRMWDSMREDCKGNDNCSYVSCQDCPLYDEVCYDGNEISGLTLMFDAEKAVKIVTQWAKDHPIETKVVNRNTKCYLCPCSECTEHKKWEVDQNGK